MPTTSWPVAARVAQLTSPTCPVPTTPMRIVAPSSRGRSRREAEERYAPYPGESCLTVGRPGTHDDLQPALLVGVHAREGERLAVGCPHHVALGPLSEDDVLDPAGLDVDRDEI